VKIVRQTGAEKQIYYIINIPEAVELFDIFDAVDIVSEEPVRRFVLSLADRLGSAMRRELKAVAAAPDLGPADSPGPRLSIALDRALESPLEECTEPVVDPRVELLRDDFESDPVERPEGAVGVGGTSAITAHLNFFED
jgi:hypothetical protein